MKKILELLVALFIITSLSLVCAAQDDSTTDAQNVTVDAPVVSSSSETSADGTTTTTDVSVVTTQPAPEPEPVFDYTPVNGKMYVAPTVQLRTLDSEITKNSDAIIDMYMSNAPMNEGDLNVYLTESVPSNVLIRATTGVDQGDSGIAQTSYVIKPGNNVHVQLHAICNKVGKYPITAEAQYYIGTDKNSLKSVSLATEFIVVEPSDTFHMDNQPTANNTKVDNGIAGMTFTTNQLAAFGAFLLLLVAMIGLALRK